MKARWMAPFRARLFSPKGFLLRAAVLLGLFLALHAFGLRASTSIICGTTPPGGAGFANRFGAMAYVVLWLAAVVVVPVLAIGAAVFAAILAIDRRRTAKRGAAAVRATEGSRAA